MACQGTWTYCQPEFLKGRVWGLYWLAVVPFQLAVGNARGKKDGMNLVLGQVVLREGKGWQEPGG